MKGNVLTTIFGLLSTAGTAVAGASTGTIHQIAAVAGILGGALFAFFAKDAGNKAS